MSRIRVLIAEDEATTRQILAEQISLIGYDVVGQAKDGDEAVALALSLQPDVGVFDIKMPGRDGLDAAREIMESAPMALLMLTGLYDPELIDRAKDIGVFAYLVKPANAETLQASIEVALRRFAELQAARQEACDLKEALETRKLVERAKGVLMQRLGLAEADAFRRLQRESNNQSRPLKHIAEAILIAEGLFKPAAAVESE